MAIFLQFLALKMCWNTYFVCFGNINQKLPKKMAQKNDNFWHFAKHRFIKKNRFVATPLLTKKLCFVKLFVLKPKTSMLNKKHNLKSGNSKDKKKGVERKTRQETEKKRNDWWRKNCNWIFWCCSFHETKAKKKQKNKETKTKTPKESKKKDKKEEKRTRTREIERERETEEEK